MRFLALRNRTVPLLSQIEPRLFSWKEEQKWNKTIFAYVYRQAGLVGFEPTIHGSKPWVLPFDECPSNLYFVSKNIENLAEMLENLDLSRLNM